MRSQYDDFFLVIPSFDGKRLLERMLPTVDCPRDRILIADIESNDGTREFAEQNGCHCIQLTRPSSLCQSFNAGIRWALERNAKYVGLANNDITLTTPTIGPMLEAFRREKRLGLIAPTQVMAHRRPPYAVTNLIKYRAAWNLQTVSFDFDFNYPENQPRLLEADYCEFTFVIVDSKVFAEIGLLDEEFGFYHEDGDFCFRAAKAGWRCSYLQTAQIIHYEGSTTEESAGFDKFRYIAANRRRFHRKHSVQGVRFDPVDTSEPNSWSVINFYMFNMFWRYGLVAQDGPRMIFSHPDYYNPTVDDYRILFTVWETDEVPRRWLPYFNRYSDIIVPSDFNVQTFRKYHDNVHKVCWGIDPDRMSPWGGRWRFSDKKTFLCVFRDQYRKAFDVTIKAWIESGLSQRNCELLAFAHDLDLRKYITGPREELRTNKFTTTLDHEHSIRYVTPTRGFAFIDEMSKVYRGADFLVLNSRSEGFGFPVVEAMGCGVPCIIPEYGSTREFVVQDGCIPLSGRPAAANYTDKGFSDVGCWWEPDLDRLVAAFKLADSLSDRERAAMGEAGRQHVLANFTWKHSCIQFHDFCEQVPMRAEAREFNPGTAGNRVQDRVRRWLTRSANLAGLLGRREFGNAFVRMGNFLQRRGL